MVGQRPARTSAASGTTTGGGSAKPPSPLRHRQRSRPQYRFRDDHLHARRWPEHRPVTLERPQIDFQVAPSRVLLDGHVRLAIASATSRARSSLLRRPHLPAHDFRSFHTPDWRRCPGIRQRIRIRHEHRPARPVAVGQDKTRERIDLRERDGSPAQRLPGDRSRLDPAADRSGRPLRQARHLNATSTSECLFVSVSFRSAPFDADECGRECRAASMRYGLRL